MKSEDGQVVISTACYTSPFIWHNAAMPFSFRATNMNVHFNNYNYSSFIWGSKHCHAIVSVPYKLQNFFSWWILGIYRYIDIKLNVYKDMAHANHHAFLLFLDTCQNFPQNLALIRRFCGVRANFFILQRIFCNDFRRSGAIASHDVAAAT